MTVVMYDLENIKKADNNVTKKSQKFNFITLTQKIEKLFDGDVVKHIVFMSLYSDGTQHFRTMLLSKGIEVVHRYSKTKKNTYEGMEYKYNDSDIDAKLVHFMSEYANNYDNAVLVSGDKDLAEAFSCVDAYRVAMSWKDNMSTKIKESSNDYYYLDDLFK